MESNDSKMESEWRVVVAIMEEHFLGLFLVSAHQGTAGTGDTNVLDGSSEGFHFAEAFLQILLWQMMSELGIAFIGHISPAAFPAHSFSG